MSDDRRFRVPAFGARAIPLTPYRLAVGVLFVAYFALCVHGIANYWQWGHNGFNGAAFSHAARNSLRFGIVGQAQYYMGLEPPPPHEIYTHHPMMLHLHLVVLHRIFGFGEWVGRLVPVGYSFACLVMLFVAARRFFGRAMALATATTYALIPLPRIFATMIDHEQGGIFWSLFFVYQYAVFVRTRTWKNAALAMLGVTMAVQFDWPGYYLAFFVACHALGVGLARPGRLFTWRREYSFIAAFSAVVLGNFAAFFAFVVSVRGSFAEMMNAAESRAREPSGYWQQVWDRVQDMEGPLNLALLATWTLLFGVRLARGRTRLGDIFPAFFLLAQVIHSIVFKEAGYVHSYWTYWACPAIAFAGGFLVVESLRVLSRGVGYLETTLASVRASRPVQTLGDVLRVLVFGLVVVAPLWHAVPFARAQHRWGFTAGFGCYIVPYDDQWLVIEWLKDVARRHDRESTVYLVSQHLEARIEILYYLDSPFHFASSPTAPSGPSRPGQHRVLLVDWQKVHAQGRLSDLMRRYAVRVYDGHLVAVDLDAPPSFEAYVHATRPAPWWWRWLVNPVRPPIRWIRDPDEAAIRARIRGSAEITDTVELGDGQGASEPWDCPLGFAVVSIDHRQGASAEHPALADVRVRCAPLPAAGDAPLHAQLESPRYGTSPEGPATRVACPLSHVATGFHARVPHHVTGIDLLCTHVNADGALVGPPTLVESRTNDGTEPIVFTCPEGSVVFGLRGGMGPVADRLGVSCARVDPDFLAASRTARSASLR